MALFILYNVIFVFPVFSFHSKFVALREDKNPRDVVKEA
jgi:hypothetical protein